MFGIILAPSIRLEGLSDSPPQTQIPPKLPRGLRSDSTINSGLFWTANLTEEYWDMMAFVGVRPCDRP
jgi:hypothetical protein